MRSLSEDFPGRTIHVKLNESLLRAGDDFDSGVDLWGFLQPVSGCDSQGSS